MSKNRQNSLEKNLDQKADSGEFEKRPDGSVSEQEKLLAGYPGAALLVAADGSVLHSNAKAAGLEALIQHDAAPEIKNPIEEARSNGAVAAGSVSLNSAKGETVLEITVVPGLGKTDEMVVMARDMTMERNLRTALVESRQRYKDLAWKSAAQPGVISVPAPPAVKSSIRMACGTRPSMMTAPSTSASTAPRQVSIFGIMPPEMMPSLIIALA